MKRTTYYRKTARKEDQKTRKLDAELVDRLESLDGYEQVYGYRKVTKLFEKYNHKKVYRHMRELKILQARKQKKKKHIQLPYSVPSETNERWEADITYIWDGYRMNYLCAVQDSFDKEIIGDHYGLRCTAEEVIKSFEDAIMKRFGTLEYQGESSRITVRVDQGSQYISKQLQRRCYELGIRLEYCGIKCPNDKPYIENFFSRYKCEEVYRNEYSGFSNAYKGWRNYKYWYNTERIHQGIGYKTIPEFKKQNIEASLPLIQHVFMSTFKGA